MDTAKLEELATLVENGINDPNFKRLIEHVLTRIPDNYMDEFPSFSVYEGPAREGAQVMDDDVALVIFDIPRLTQLTGGDEAVLIGVIAHELAHVFRKDYVTIKEDLTDRLKLEDETDKLAVMWGFRTEVEAFRKKMGPPTDMIKAQKLT
jgi:hypothetical protein